jgi:hypothetical protein
LAADAVDTGTKDVAKSSTKLNPGGGDKTLGRGQAIVKHPTSEYTLGLNWLLTL